MSSLTHPATETTRTAAARASAAVRSEVGLARVALGVVGLHVIDDNFLQPSRGTSPFDHLVSGLVPLAIIVAAGVYYGRARAGVRGALALLFGFFGILGGIEGARALQDVGLSGDDYTGLLSIVAGFVLLGLGVVTLWRSRRRDDRLAWRYARRALFAFAGLLALVFVLVPIAIAYYATHVAPASVPEANLGAPYEQVEFTTSDGFLLKGWYVPSKNGAAVISFPGRSGTRLQARMLARHGYGVLLFDRRGEGESEGDWNVFGWQGERDLYAAAAFLRSRNDVDPNRIGGIGRSVGGEMLIGAAAESDAFKAVVSEGGSSRSVRDDVANLGVGVDTFPNLVMQSVITAATAVFTNNLPPEDLEGLSARISPRAVFFIYGEHGQGGTERRPNQAFYAAAGEPKEIWEVPGAEHVGGITTRPEEYERRVMAFFDRELLGR